VIGGQSARGHGHVAVNWLTEQPDGAEAYETYLSENKDQLLAGIMDGTLCSDSTVVG